jgi:hypothetical protein
MGFNSVFRGLNLLSEYLTEEVLEGFGDFKIGRQVTHTVECADILCYWQKEKLCYRASLID